jgi:hypothetical protein
VSPHYGLAIYNISKYLKAKKKNYGNSNTSKCKKILPSKNPLKETKILQGIINSLIIDLKFQHKPKYLLSKIFIYKKK